MWLNLILGGLDLLGRVFGYFSDRSTKIREYERLVKQAISSWEKRIGAATKLRKDHAAVDERLEEKWREEFSLPAKPEAGSKIIAPEVAYVEEPFKVQFVGVPIGSVLMVDQKWVILTIGRDWARFALNSPGNRRLGAYYAGQLVAETAVRVEYKPKQPENAG